MATAAQLVEMAASQIGYTESPANSNKTKYGEWYGLNGQPWCDMFVSWCAAQVGASDAVGKYAYTPSHANFFKGAGRWVGRGGTPQPGDIVFFHGSSRICHVGIVEKAVSSTKVQTIEGNTSTTSNDNGGSVMRRTRSLGTEGSSWYIAGYGRPAYDAESTETVKGDQGGDEMVCIIQPNEKNYLVYFTGSEFFGLAHPDDVTALDMAYQQTHDGAHIPSFKMGSESAPWASRLLEAVSNPLTSL